MSVPPSSPLRPHPAALPLSGPEDALGVLFAAASRPRQAEHLALLLDHAHRGLGCLVIVGGGSIRPVAELLVHLACQEGGLAALVLATVRPPGTPSVPGAAELVTFHDLREQFDELGIDLVDWFLLADRRAASLAELTDSQPRWRPPRR